MKKTILVTGGTGYIGSHTVVELIGAGYDVVIVDNLYNSSKAVLKRIEKITGVLPKFYEVDILDGPALNQVFEENHLDAVIHFAGYKAVGESVSKPLTYYQNNIAGSLNLYETMLKHQVYNLVFSSSATVYGDPASVPICEDFPLGPTTNPYGTSKLYNEQILRDVCKAYPEFSQFKELPAWGFYIRHAKGIVFDNVKLTAKERDYRPAIVVHEAEDVDLRKVRYKEPGGGKKQVHVYKSKKVKK